MRYNGKKASLFLREQLKERVNQLVNKPRLAIISASTHPSILSFIKIKRSFAEAVGVTMVEFSFPDNVDEVTLIQKITEITNSGLYTGIVVQLPLPKTINSKAVLDTIPKNFDVDILGKDAWKEFTENNTPIPPVVGAIKHIVEEMEIKLTNKKIVIIGEGRLVGKPLSIWFKNSGIIPELITFDTSDALRKIAYKEADIIITGIGSPHHISADDCKTGVVIIDAGTSEESGLLAGDANPNLEEIASIFTPVPGGVGPLTVAFLFSNVVTFAEKR